MNSGNLFLVAMLLIEIDTVFNGSVALAEQQIRETALTDQPNVEVETRTNATSGSVDVRNQEESSVGHHIKEESSTSGYSETGSERAISNTAPTMDLITVIWYGATLVALVSFFVVMACADTSRCYTPKPADIETPVPPTPAPSYRLFAPPSYESVIAKRPDSIFIIPVNRNSNQESVHFTENLVTNLENVIEPARGAYSESATPLGYTRRSENILSVIV